MAMSYEAVCLLFIGEKSSLCQEVNAVIEFYLLVKKTGRKLGQLEINCC